MAFPSTLQVFPSKAAMLLHWDESSPVNGMWAYAYVSLCVNAQAEVQVRDTQAHMHFCLQQGEGARARTVAEGGTEGCTSLVDDHSLRWSKKIVRVHLRGSWPLACQRCFAGSLLLLFSLLQRFFAEAPFPLMLLRTFTPKYVNSTHFSEPKVHDAETSCRTLSDGNWLPWPQG